jgi:hypothetical protein
MVGPASGQEILKAHDWCLPPRPPGGGVGYFGINKTTDCTAKASQLALTCKFKKKWIVCMTQHVHPPDLELAQCSLAVLLVRYQRPTEDFIKAN